MRLKQSAAAALLATLLAGCTPLESAINQAAYPDKVPPTGSVYQSKLGNFTCRVPELMRPGATEAEDATANTSSVEFTDDFGALLRIESVQIPASERGQLSDDKLPAALDSFFDRIVLAQGFAVVSKDTKILRREHLTTSAGATLFVVVHIPSGSNLVDIGRDGTMKRMDSVRGVLLFVQNGYLYSLQNQERPMQSGDSTLQQRTDDLLKELKDALAGMQFAT